MGNAGSTVGSQQFPVAVDVAVPVEAPTKTGARKLSSVHIEVRLTGGDPEFVYVEEQGAPMPSADDSLSARVTLRLPETLKAIIDSAAQDAGVSANTWLLQQISKSANPQRRGPGGRRMTGYGRS